MTSGKNTAVLFYVPMYFSKLSYNAIMIYDYFSNSWVITMLNVYYQPSLIHAFLKETKAVNKSPSHATKLMKLDSISGSYLNPLT
jgi:hypothetical protein